MKLLIVEGSYFLAERLRVSLRSHFIIDVVKTGSEGIKRAREVEYAVIIVDNNLPDTDGLEFCKRAREAMISTSILVLRSDKDAESGSEILYSGADDYVTKPLDKDELIARAAALARRRNRQYVGSIFKIGQLVIDTNKHEVHHHGIAVTLRRKEFAILVYLARNRGRAVSRDMIMENVWESDKESWNNTVDVHIKHLRDKVDRPFGTSLIKTSYGVGYILDD